VKLTETLQEKLKPNILWTIIAVHFYSEHPIALGILFSLLTQMSTILGAVTNNKANITTASITACAPTSAESFFLGK
jgi:hypothetical protein